MTSEKGSQVARSIEEVETDGAGHTNSEGTAYQALQGPKPHRKHFFSPLDQAYADAVHRDAETVVYTAEEEVWPQFTLLSTDSFKLNLFSFQRLVRRKIDRTVLPLVICRLVF